MIRPTFALILALCCASIASAGGEKALVEPSLQPLSVSITAPQAAVIPTLGAAVILPESAVGDVQGVRPEVRAAAAEELKGNAAGQDMDRFAAALGQQDTSLRDFGVAQVFDNVGQFGSSDFGYGAVVSAANPQAGGDAALEDGEEVKASKAAKTLHKEWEEAAKKRREDFEKKVAETKVGPFGVALTMRPLPGGRGVAVGAMPTYEGKPLGPDTPQVVMALYRRYEALAEAKAKELIQEQGRLMREEEQRHAEVHRKMDELDKQAGDAMVAKGKDLQSWGIPNVTPINLFSYMRYTRLYRMDGKPTPLGEELHDVLAPLIAQDKDFLTKVSRRQFNEAVQILQDSQRYRIDPDSPDAQKLRRLGMPIQEGYDYPEWRKALVQKAREILTSPMRADDKDLGFHPLAEDQHPAGYLKTMLKEVEAEMERLSETLTEPTDEAKELGKLFFALHAATGEPFMAGPGMMAAVPVTHEHLRTLVAELQRRNAPDNVIEAAMRSFPLGESLWRMGIQKEWARGLTGKGVKIAILDNGVDFDHPDFKDAKVTADENFTRDRGDLRKGGHGTPMASIFHAIAPDAEIQNYQVLSNTMLPGVALIHDTDKALMKAMDRAKANGANLISMSLGSAAAYSDDEMAAKIAEFAKEGIVVVVSAGNSGAELPRGLQLGSPGTSPKAITVGAVDYHGKKAAFSSSGLVFNPTDSTVADKVDVYAYGVNVKAALLLSKQLYQVEPVPYMYGSGTSPATPHVVGTLALAMQAALDAGKNIMVPDGVEAARAALRKSIKDDKVIPVLDTAGRVVDAYVQALP